MTGVVVGYALLTVSLISLAIQGWALVRILLLPLPPLPTERMAYRGLRRTALTRVGAALLYIAVGLYAINRPEDQLFSLIAFTVVQIAWQLNSLADVRLRRRLAHIDLPPRGRHRKR